MNIRKLLKYNTFIPLISSLLSICVVVYASWLLDYTNQKITYSSAINKNIAFLSVFAYEISNSDAVGGNRDRVRTQFILVNSNIEKLLINLNNMSDGNLHELDDVQLKHNKYKAMLQRYFGYLITKSLDNKEHTKRITGQFIASTHALSTAVTQLGGLYTEEIRQVSILALALVVTAMLGSMLGVFLFGRLLSKSIWPPVEQLQTAIIRLKASTSNHQVLNFSDNELGDLGRAFNEMSEKLFNSKILLKKSKDELQHILDSTQEGIYGLDLEGKTNFANGAAYDLTGFSLKEMLGKSQHQLIHHSHSDGTAYSREDCNIYASLREGKIRNIRDEVFWRKDGSSFPVEYTSSPMFDEGGNITGAVVVFTDISERKQSEEKMLAIKARLEATLDTMADAVILSDENGTILSFNKAAENIFGYKEADVIDKNVSIITSDQDQSNHDAYIKHYVAGGVPSIIGKGREVVGRRANGEMFPVDLAVAELRLEGQRYFSALLRDTSERTKHEKTIEKYTRELERSNKELDDFAYVASHDLKAPLRGIMQLTKWIEEDSKDTLNDQTKEHLKLLQNRVSRLEKLLDDLLSYSRVGRVHGNFKEVNFTAMMDDIVQLLEPPAGFKIIYAKDALAFVTLSVPLEQIFRNLISNAIKHHDHNGGTIEITAESTESGFEFTVSDDGPGIAPEQHDRVFGIFQTLRPRDEVEGSGMGLAIIKKLLDSYRSNITIESDGIRGTRMCFTWPDEKNLRAIIDE